MMNSASVVIAVLLALAVVIALFVLIYDRAHGNSSCGGSCSSCPYANSCKKKK